MRMIPAFCIVLLCASALAAEVPRIDGKADASRPTVTADLPADLVRKLGPGAFDVATARSILRLVRIDDAAGTPGPALFGNYSLIGDTLCFQPEFPLGVGHYRALLSLPGRELQQANYEVRPAATQPASVATVYPSSNKLPANLLKFYVHFSQPIRQTDRIFDQIHILDEAGKPVYDPWRRFQQWSDDGTRFTLWIHPGRVKQGVNLREDFGPVLLPNHVYTLVIDADVLDLSGRPLEARYEKRFTATAEDHTRLTLDEWKLAVPHAGTRDPLIVTFPKPLDRALILRLITVRDASDQMLAGQIDVGDRETSWTFRPHQAWTAAPHTLRADELLEDLAGNTAVRVFDTDMHEPQTQPSKKSISFRPG